MPDKNSFKKTFKKLKSAGKMTRLTFLPVKSSPDERLGELFSAVQLARVHADGMTFVNLAPNKSLRKIVREYELQSGKPDFDLAAFVKDHFEEYISVTS